MSFTFEPLEISDVVLVHPTRHRDPRGFFQESYRASAFAEAGIDATFVQDNLARSTRGVLRGLHYQLPPAAQGKLMGVVRGSVFDVAVDLRVGARSYGRWVGRTLDAEAGELLWIPPGFAHGYVVLSDVAEVAYKVTAEYAPPLDRGVLWNDPAIGIEWPVDDPVVSPKDRVQPVLADAENPFTP
ncbi:MAG TPA: dTDP-4-dehydrorhamnose 3,5-epimerase [Longimicrobiales bacterium]|nr:dTDP-4-dehydrorhamnose 3,5-epimerase [Longimicrobiales bacterium]